MSHEQNNLRIASKRIMEWKFGVGQESAMLFEVKFELCKFVVHSCILMELNAER